MPGGARGALRVPLGGFRRGRRDPGGPLRWPAGPGTRGCGAGHGEWRAGGGAGRRAGGGGGGGASKPPPGGGGGGGGGVCPPPARGGRRGVRARGRRAPPRGPR